MRKTRIALLMIIALSFTAIPLGLFNFGFAKPVWTIPDYQPVDWQSGLAGDVAMPSVEDTMYSSTKYSSGLASSNDISTSPVVGDQVVDWYLGAIGNTVPTMTLRAIREYVEVWVADDLQFHGIEDDPRNANPLDWNVTDEMCEYLADEFNDNIYAVLTDYYGTTADRDGTGTIFEAYGFPPDYWDWLPTDNGQRVILKIFNIRDDNYNDPTYPSYVVGFYSSTYTGSYYNRNMIHIDNWRWWQRLGPEGYQWYPDTNPELEVTRPNLYESTVAHEYQHNIHGDQIPGDFSYMNEACSLFSEPICGYELDAGQIAWFMATPDNSLIEWGDQGNINILADYGASFLWALYLTDHYGYNFMGDYVKNGIIGKAGINALLAPFGKDFDDVFHDWRIANLIQAKYGKYGYQLDELQAINPYAELNFDELTPLKIHEVTGKKMPWTSAADEFGETFTRGTDSVPEGYPTDTFNVGAYGSDYIHFTDFRGLEVFSINGADLVETPGWEFNELDTYWYSGAADLLNTVIATEVYVDPADPTLTLTTYWDIEDYWDFGFVQVSEDGKWDSDWISLANEYTTDLYDPAAIVTAVENLPGLTSWSGFITEDGMVTMTFDLSAYAGESIHLGFRFVTDWATTYEGWYLFNVIVSGVEYIETLEHLYPEVDFMVTVVEKFRLPHRCTSYFVHDMWFLNDETEFGFVAMLAHRWEDIIIIVSPMMDLGNADYQFKVTRFGGCGR